MGSSLATPTPVDKTPAKVVQARQDSEIADSSQLAAAISSFPADLSSIAAGISVGEAILTNIGSDYLNLINSYLIESSTNNLNLIPPAQPIYPRASASDAPDSLSETDLRKAIYIPPGFTYGRVPPVLFLPGTAALAGQNFGPNYGKLLKDRKSRGSRNYNSTFIATLRNQWRGERAPTSPTTNIYSIFDEHRGTVRSRTSNASGALNDAPRGVGSVEHRSSKGICTAALPGGNTEQRPRRACSTTP
ncbi:hypothetical protein KC315_g17208 [Hortaea werneckii]|nr:hypothetical protein KC315_g17208 [Hortaea werneckii]KAI7334773.1 hypothetical protein KC354_g17936 [Hortaea werneckii]